MGLVCESNMEFLFNLFAKEMSMVSWAVMYLTFYTIRNNIPTSHTLQHLNLTHTVGAVLALGICACTKIIVSVAQMRCLSFNGKLLQQLLIPGKEVAWPLIRQFTFYPKFRTRHISAISKKIKLNKSGIPNAFFNELGRGARENIWLWAN